MHPLCNRQNIIPLNTYYIKLQCDNKSEYITKHLFTYSYRGKKSTRGDEVLHKLVSTINYSHKSFIIR